MNNYAVTRVLALIIMFTFFQRLIQEIHTDVINDDINALKQHTESPIPDIVFSGKDANGLTSLHKVINFDFPFFLFVTNRCSRLQD